jgi:integrase/recombinase XerD
VSVDYFYARKEQKFVQAQKKTPQSFDYGVYSGRRKELTNLAERGVGVRVLMALAGHSNMATTQRYIDLRPAMLKAAVELV